MLVFVKEFLGFFPSLSSGIGRWMFGGGGVRRGLPGALKAEAGEHTPLQLCGVGVRNKGRLFLGFGASQALEKLPGPCVWAHCREEEQRWLLLLGRQEDGCWLETDSVSLPGDTWLGSVRRGGCAVSF